MNNMLTATPSMTTTSPISFMQIAHKWVTNAYISLWVWTWFPLKWACKNDQNDSSSKSQPFKEKKLSVQGSQPKRIRKLITSVRAWNKTRNRNKCVKSNFFCCFSCSRGQHVPFPPSLILTKWERKPSTHWHFNRSEVELIGLLIGLKIAINFINRPECKWNSNNNKTNRCGALRLQNIILLSKFELIWTRQKQKRKKNSVCGFVFLSEISMAKDEDTQI